MKQILTFFLGGVVVLGAVWFFKRDAGPAPEPAGVIGEAPVSMEPGTAGGEAPVAPSPLAPGAPVASNPPRNPSSSTPPEAPAVVPMQPPPSASTGVAPPPQAAPVAPAPAPSPVVTPAPPPPPQPKTVTLADGTLIPVRLLETVSTETAMPGDTFAATLDQALVVDGFVIAERGSRVEGKIVSADRAGRVKGLAFIALELTHINTADKQRIAVSTASFEKQADKDTKNDATKIGVGAAIGAAIGAIAGGGKGAAIGAAAGGGAGTGAVLATRGKDAVLPVETKISFQLTRPVRITEKLR